MMKTKNVVLLKDDRQFKPGDRVHVDFLSSNAAETDGTRIRGFGTVDRAEPDGFVMGRLDSGQPFGCPSSDVKAIVGCTVSFDPGVDITNTLADAIAHGDGMMQVTEIGVRHIGYGQMLKGDEPQSKYDWSVIPAHVNWMATDEDGVACGWLVEPNVSGNAWRHYAHHSAHFFIQKRQNPYRGDWKQSLEKRPDHTEQEPKGGDVEQDA